MKCYRAYTKYRNLLEYTKHQCFLLLLSPPSKRKPRYETLRYDTQVSRLHFSLKYSPSYDRISNSIATKAGTNSIITCRQRSRKQLTFYLFLKESCCRHTNQISTNMAELQQLLGLSWEQSVSHQ
jgi:hypothetical protein